MDDKKGTRTMGSPSRGDTPRDAAKLVGETVGKYRIARVLGEGGMGAVYLGERPEIESRVAIKVLHQQYVEDADMVRRFFDEARAVNRVGHPGLVQIHDYDHQDGVGVYLIMEYLKGRSLRDELNKHKRLPHQRVVRLLLQIASALAAVHEKGIIHRDLKPENIQLVFDPAVTGGERVKLLDFGIAKLRGDGSLGKSTRTGMLLGTPLYMAPEQCKDTKGVDHRADIYAVGAITYELLCGRPPYQADSMYELVEQHLTCEPDDPRELAQSVPRKLGAMVLKALAAKPDARYQTMEALADAARAATRSSMMESARHHGETGGADSTGPMPGLSDEAISDTRERRDSWDMDTVGLEAGEDEVTGLETTVASERHAISSLGEAATMAAATGEHEAEEADQGEAEDNEEGVLGVASTLAADTTSRMMAGETEAQQARGSRKVLGLALGAALLVLVAALVFYGSQQRQDQPPPGFQPASEPAAGARATAMEPGAPAAEVRARPPGSKAPVVEAREAPVAPDAGAPAAAPAPPPTIASRKKRRRPRRRKRKKKLSPAKSDNKPAARKQPKKKSESDIRFTDLED